MATAGTSTPTKGASSSSSSLPTAPTPFGTITPRTEQPQADHNPTPAYMLRWALPIDILNFLVGNAFWWLSPLPMLYLLAFTYRHDLLSQPAKMLFILAYVIWKVIITSAVNHRFFSHRAWSCSRPTTLLLFLLACSAGQRNPLWWSSKHSRHHKYCDTPGDPHSTLRDGFWYAWIGWVASPYEMHTDWQHVHPSFKTWELYLASIVGCFVPYVEMALFLQMGGPVAAITSALATWVSCTGLLFFNVIFHHEDEPQDPSAKAMRGKFGCWATSECVRYNALYNCTLRPFLIFVADLSGELDHYDHHVNPNRAYRPPVMLADVAYWVFIGPGEKLGLFWNLRGPTPLSPRA